MFSPVMIVSNDKNRNTCYEVYSPKLERMVKLYSDLEYDHWVLVEANPSIAAFCEKPVKIKSRYKGQRMESLLDMWIKDKNGSESFVKIKYDYQIELTGIKNSKKEIQDEIQKSWCQESGFDYRIITEKTIRSNMLYLDNMKQMIPIIAQYEEVVETDIKSISKLLDSYSRISISDISYELNTIPFERIRNTVYWMIYKGMVNSDVKAVSLGHKTQIWKKR